MGGILVLGRGCGDSVTGRMWSVYVCCMLTCVKCCVHSFVADGAKHKSRDLLGVYVVGVMIIVVLCLVISISSFAFSDELGAHYNKKIAENPSFVSNLACVAKLTGCSCCGCTVIAGRNSCNATAQYERGSYTFDNGTKVGFQCGVGTQVRWS